MYLVYAMKVGLIVGLIIGAFPFFYGAMKENIKLGAWGFFGTVVAGVILGLLGAIPTAAIFIYNIKKRS